MCGEWGWGKGRRKRECGPQATAVLQCKMVVMLGVGDRTVDEGLEIRSAYLVAQLVKNLSAMRETWVQSLVWGNPLEKGKATHSSVLAWRIPWTVYSPWDRKGQTRLSDFHFHFKGCIKKRSQLMTG